MAKVSRNAGKVNRNIKTNSSGAGDKPRLKGVGGSDKSTFNRGNESAKAGKRNDLTDKAGFKRGDGRGPKAANDYTDSSKFKRGDGKLTGQKSDLTYPIQKPLSRGD